MKMDQTRFFYLIVMAIFLISFVLYMYVNYKYFFFEYESTLEITNDVLQPTLCVISFIILAVMRPKTLRRLLIVSCITLCILSLLSAYTLLVDYAQVMDYSIVNFIEGAMALLIGLLLVINLAMYIMKLSRNTTMMFIAVLGLMVINIANILTPVRFDLGFEIIKETLLTDIPMISLMVVLMIIMRSKTIKSETMLYSIRSSFNDIKDAGVPIGVTILRSNLKEIIKAETIAEWDRGYQFYLKSAHPNEYRILFDRRGSKVFASLSFLGDQSVFDSYRMILRGIATDNGDVETCDTVRFYGEDGFFIQLIVVETYEVDEHMSLRSLRRNKQTEEPEADSEQTCQ